LSYLVLARKSRPKTFREVVGQGPIVRTLQNALTQDRVSHALIFSGVRGVGKTTLARIMAKALNCAHERAAEPCNDCASCEEINAGSSVDLVEIDGASNRGIQEIRELKENIRFMPTASRYKIIIIDEVHMLTTEAFNALLKTLEEPPSHVYFMFATTELHRVPVTILSRCQRYELKRIGAGDLAAYFQSIADREKVKIEPAALQLVVREAGGSVRDGLSLLDQLFSYCGREVREKEVVDMLGLAGSQVVADLSAAILAGDIEAALGVLDEAYTYGMDLKRFINDLLERFRALTVCSVSREPQRLLDLPDEELAGLKECARKYSPQTLILVFNILMENLEKAGYASRPRYALEMALIKAVQAGDVVPVSEILGRLDELLPAGKEGKKKSDGGDVLTSTLDRAAALANEHGNGAVKTGIAPAQAVPAPENTAPEENDRPEAGPGGEDILPENEKAPVGTDVARPAPARETRSVRQHWNQFIAYVKERKPWMASALQMADSAHLREGELVIEFDGSAHCTMLRSRENITLLTEFALDFFQEDFRIRLHVPETGGCEVDPENGNRVKQERRALANDSLVLTAVDIFNGEVGDIRIGPRFRSPIEKPEEEPGNDAPEPNEED
jgi:DNA polymerase-3 subunit gamma/tau